MLGLTLQQYGRGYGPKTQIGKKKDMRATTTSYNSTARQQDTDATITITPQENEATIRNLPPMAGEMVLELRKYEAQITPQ